MSSAFRHFLTFVVILFLTPSSAELRTDAAQFAQLCKYDDACHELKDEEGAFIPPKKDVVEVVRTLNQPLQQYARDLGVDPVAVAGSIIAGHSLGPQMDDDTRSFYDSIKRTRFVNGLSQLYRGQSFSLGIAQIKPETAGDAEPLLAKLERRPPRTLDQITNALADPVESVKYAAAIIRQCQDAYEKRGFDVSEDPALLATMYNVGGCPRRATNAAKLQRPPRVNFFGFFVRHYRDEIVKGAGLEETPAVVDQVAYIAPRSIGQRLSSDVVLTAQPGGCAGASAQSSSTAVFARGEFKVIAAGLNCNMQDWSLIQTVSGEIGWVSNEQLRQRSETFARGPEERCDQKVLNGCIERLRTSLGRSIFKIANDGILEIDGNALKSVRQLAGDRCVEAIFVPNLDTIDKASDRPGRYVQKPFDLPDRIAVKVLDGCGTSGSASGPQPAKPTGFSQ